MLKSSLKWLITVLYLISPLFLLAQGGLPMSDQEPFSYSRHQLFIGTQIPLQYSVGYAYQVSNALSVKAQAGIITKPYDNFIRGSMEAFGLDKNLGRVIRKSFRAGTVLGLGANYHFGKNYVGIHGQYVHLRAGGITPADALGIYFKKDFSGFDPTELPAFEFNMQSNLYNVGALYGRQFVLPNPRFALNVEVSLAKVIASRNTFGSNRNFIDQTGIAKGLYRELDEELRDAYWKYGFLPTVNVYLVYKLR